MTMLLTRVKKVKCYTRSHIEKRITGLITNILPNKIKPMNFHLPWILP